MTTTPETILEVPPASETFPFAYAPAKLVVPTPRPGTISRVAIVNRLRAAQGFPVVALIAPAGSGKTTILAQWASRDDRAFAWVSIDDRDNDPLVFLRHVAIALDGVQPIDRTVLHALRSTRSLWTTAVPRVAAALASLESPCVVVLDDAARLASDESLELVSVLAAHIPERSTLAVAGRAPIGPIASIRAEGRLFEVGPELIRLSDREGEDLLRATRIELDEEYITELVDHSEGWPACLYLSALAIRDRSSADDTFAAGDDRYLAEYFRAECLATLPPEQLVFLRRSSILETLTAPLCDAVLQRTGSRRALAEVGAANLFLEPLDGDSRSYRYQRLFRDFLRRELAEEEAELVPTLHRLAADWYEANRRPLEAIGHAAKAGDVERVARLVISHGELACDCASIPVVESWLGLFERAEIERFPGVAMLGAWVHAVCGRPSEARQWLAIAEAGQGRGPLLDGLASLHPWDALIRAVLCEDGVEQMLADAEAALSGLPVSRRWHPIAWLLRGAALALLGEADEADAALARAAEAAQACRATDVGIVALGERALIAAGRGDFAAAEEVAGHARLLAARTDGGLTMGRALETAVHARTLLRHGQWEEARERLAAVRQSSPSLPRAFPWLAVQAQLELTRAYLTLRDVGASQAVLAAAREIREGRSLGLLDDEVEVLQAEVDELRDSRGAGDVGLTPAELRLIPLLASHLSFPEIGSHFVVSRNTIKTQAISIYRKLGVTNRSEAVAEASRLGLLTSTAGAIRDETEIRPARELAG